MNCSKKHLKNAYLLKMQLSYGVNHAKYTSNAVCHPQDDSVWLLVPRIVKQLCAQQYVAISHI